MARATALNTTCLGGDGVDDDSDAVDCEVAVVGAEGIGLLVLLPAKLLEV